MSNMEAGLGQGFMNGWQHIAEGESAELPLGRSPGSGKYGKGKRLEIGSVLNT